MKELLLPPDDAAPEVSYITCSMPALAFNSSTRHTFSIQIELVDASGSLGSQVRNWFHHILDPFKVVIVLVFREGNSLFLLPLVQMNS
ncbi:MAG: hypothetical protein P8P49_06175 [Opitutales bacterium]|nr:hypothetical protein [Opitutales bacterium]